MHNDKIILNIQFHILILLIIYSILMLTIQNRLVSLKLSLFLSFF